MHITVDKVDYEKDKFSVWISGEELSFVIGKDSIFFKLNAQQLDTLYFMAGSALQDSELLAKEKK